MGNSGTLNRVRALKRVLNAICFGRRKRPARRIVPDKRDRRGEKTDADPSHTPYKVFCQAFLQKSRVPPQISPFRIRGSTSERTVPSR